MEMETEKWRALMHRLLNVTMFLAKQGLPFRELEEEDPPLNEGNFLATVDLFSKSDPLLKQYLLSLKQGACESYLSPETQDELISALAKHAREKLAMDIKSAPYFALIFDCTPVVSFTDQMAEVVRYVKVGNGKVEVKEAFLRLFPRRFPSWMKESAGPSSDILKNLERDGLDIMMCRAQCYDAGATRAFQRDMQDSILAKNKKAIFMGRMEHSLNMCAYRSFQDDVSWNIFFGVLEDLLSFFAACPHRLDVLLGHTGGSLSRPSPTRWCTHHAAVQLVKEKFDQIVLALETLCESQQSKDISDWAAGHHWANISDFTFLCYLYFWCDALREVDVTQQSLQDLALEKVATKLEALGLLLHEKSNHLVESAIEQALLKSAEYGISVEESDRYQEWRASEQECDSGLAVQEENRRGMLACIDHCGSELLARARATKEVADRFEALQAKSLLSATEEELKVSVPKLTGFYDELSESELLKEILSLRGHLKEAEIDLAKAEDWAALKVLTFIAGWGFLKSHPTLSRSLQLYLTVSASVAPWERNLSKLSCVEGYLRSILEQRRYSDIESSDLALLSVENESVNHSDFNEVIDKLAALKASKGKS